MLRNSSIFLFFADIFFDFSYIEWSRWWSNAYIFRLFRSNYSCYNVFTFWFYEIQFSFSFFSQYDIGKESIEIERKKRLSQEAHVAHGDLVCWMLWRVLKEMFSVYSLPFVSTIHVKPNVFQLKFVRDETAFKSI